MTRTQTSGFIDLAHAQMTGDVEVFKKTLLLEKKSDPFSARELAELFILKLTDASSERDSPAARMLVTAVNLLVDLAPVLSFDETQKRLTLRALAVAEAVCIWASEDESLGEVMAAREEVQNTDFRVGYKAALKEGIVDRRGNPRSLLAKASFA